MNWFKRIFTRRIELNITIEKEYLTALYIRGENKYTVNLNPTAPNMADLDLKTVLCHELGHFVDNLKTGLPKDVNAGYENMHVFSSLALVKWEASAWRNAKKIYPGFCRKTAKYSFTSYVRNFRP